MENQRREWASQHAVLGRLLAQEGRYPLALRVFLEHHAAVHSTRLDVGSAWSLQDEVLAGLNEAQLRCVLPGSGHSIVWILWHITRIEDVTVNELLAGSRQVFRTRQWEARLAAAFPDVGNEMSPGDIVRLSQTVDVKAMLNYRLAVARRTRAVLSRLDPALLAQPPTRARLERLIDLGDVRPAASWLLNYWGGHPASNLLLMPATRHPFVHFNEVQRMRPKLKRLQAAGGSASDRD